MADAFHTDEFAAEVETLRRNHEFMTLLGRLKADRSRISLEDVEKDLR